MPMSKYEAALGKDRANYQPLSPVSFLERSALVYPSKSAIVDGDRVITYAQMWQRCRQAADALRKAGIGKDDTVSVFSPNSVAALEMHYAAGLAGGVLNAINYRLDAKTVGFILEHAESKAFLVDSELMPVAKAALADVKHPLAASSYIPSLGAARARRLQGFGAGTPSSRFRQHPVDAWPLQLYFELHPEKISPQDPLSKNTYLKDTPQWSSRPAHKRKGAPQWGGPFPRLSGLPIAIRKRT